MAQVEGELLSYSPATQNAQNSRKFNFPIIDSFPAVILGRDTATFKNQLNWKKPTYQTDIVPRLEGHSLHQ